MTTGAESTRNEIIKASRYLYWPLIVAVTLLLFSGQIRALLSEAGEQFNRTTSITASGVTISLSSSTFPAPTSDVAPVLAKLNDETIRLIMSTELTGLDVLVCSTEDSQAFSDVAYPDLNDSLKLLKSLGLLSACSIPQILDASCQHEATIYPTPLFKEVKVYFIDVLQSLSIKHSS